MKEDTPQSDVVEAPPAEEHPVLRFLRPAFLKKILTSSVVLDRSRPPHLDKYAWAVHGAIYERNNKRWVTWARHYLFMALRQHVDGLQPEPKLANPAQYVKLYVVGSRLTGLAHTRSDLNIAIVPPEDWDFDARSALIHRIAAFAQNIGLTSIPIAVNHRPMCFVDNTAVGLYRITFANYTHEQLLQCVRIERAIRGEWSTEKQCNYINTVARGIESHLDHVAANGKVDHDNAHQAAYWRISEQAHAMKHAYNHFVGEVLARKAPAEYIAQ